MAYDDDDEVLDIDKAIPDGFHAIDPDTGAPMMDDDEDDVDEPELDDDEDDDEML